MKREHLIWIPPYGEKSFFKENSYSVYCGFVLTGVLSFLGLMMSAWGIKNRIWAQMGRPILQHGIWF